MTGSEVSRVQEPEPRDARKAMFAERDRLLAEHQHITTAAELAPLMGVHEREYWNWCLERALAADTYTRKEETHG